MTKRQKIQEMRLVQLENEFLHSCVRECAQGRWGLFGRNDHLDPEGRYWVWPEAQRLRNLAREIHSPRTEFGQTNEYCERFIQLCSMRGPNVSGEPELVSEFLDQLTGT